MEVADRVAIVTGASRGIGKRLAVELGRAGIRVVVVARTVEARKHLPGTLWQTAEAIEASGGVAHTVAADLARPDDLDRVVSDTLVAFGRIDILVNNAAATADRAWGAALADLTLDAWKRQFDVNLHAPYALLRAAAPIMAANGGGRIINLTTGRHGGEGGPVPGVATPLAYPASKAALDQLCVSVAPQLRALGVSIVNVNPGFVRTEMVELMEQAGVDASAAIPIDVPTKALVHLACCADPFAYHGMVVDAAEIVRREGL